MEGLISRENNESEAEVVCSICKTITVGVGGQRGENLCERCNRLVEVAKQANKLGLDRKKRLTKSQKKRLWHKRGKVCETCGVSDVGGQKYAIHPFRPANWDGTLDTVRVLYATCLGDAAGERDRIFEYIHAQEMC